MEVFKIFLTLLSFIAPQMVFQDFFEKVCNKYFFDSISNFVSSDLILKVQPIKDSKVFNQHKQYKQKFKVLKNYLPWFQVNDSMEVGFFGREDRVICVAGEMKEEWTLIIFVDFEYDGFYKLSALPIFWDEITDMIFDDLAENPDKVLGKPRLFATRSKSVVKPGLSLTLECTGYGYPPPLYRWWYKDMPIHTHKDLPHKVTNTFNSTELKIFSPKEIYYSFVCEALNVAGYAKHHFEINKHLKTEDDFDYSLIPCPPNNTLPCQHNSSCYIDIHSCRKHCRCKENYIGERCETLYYGWDWNEEKKTPGFLGMDLKKKVFIIAPVVAFMLLGVIIIIILVYTKHKNQKVTHMEDNQQQEEI